MKKKFGLFMVNGERTQYATIPCTGLTKMHIQSCDNLEELHQVIEQDPNIPATTDYVILEYWEYYKPMPQA